MKNLKQISLALLFTVVAVACKENTSNAKKEIETKVETVVEKADETIKKVESIEADIENATKELEKEAIELQNSLDNLSDI